MESAEEVVEDGESELLAIPVSVAVDDVDVDGAVVD